MVKISVFSGSRLYSFFLLLLSFICITITYYVVNTKNISIKTAYLESIFIVPEEKGNQEETATTTPIVITSTVAPTVNATLPVATVTTTPNDEYINSLTFDELIREFCPVADNKAGYPCLDKLKRYRIDVNKYESETPIVYYHTFWKLEEAKPYHLRVMILKLLSYLATQDLAKTRLILWVQNEFSPAVNKTIHDKFGYYFREKLLNVWVLNFTDLCSQGIFQQRNQNCIQTQNGNSVAFSDFIRFLVLYKYGGIYTDGDVFFLRDMRPFWRKNFVHRWSFTPDYNTAIMGLQLNRTKAIDRIYETILHVGAAAGHHVDLVGGFYPARIKDTIHALNGGDIYNYTDFVVYHSILFDPAWLCNDGVLPRLDAKIVCVFREFYDTPITAEEFDISKFYGGSFSFHLHLANCGSCQITPTTYFHHVETYFSKKLDKLGP